MADDRQLKRVVRQYADVDSKFYDGPVWDPLETEIGRRYADELKALLGGGPKKVLDVGAGTGYVSLVLARLGHEVTGVDLSRAMLSIASAKAGALGLDVRLVEGDADDLPFSGRPFDAVVSRHVLWTLPHPEQAIRGWSRLVRRGGKVVVIDGGSQARGLKRLVRRPYFMYRAAREGRSIGEVLRCDYPAGIRRQIPGAGGLTGTGIAGYLERAGVASVSVKDAVYLNDLALRARPALFRSLNKTFLDFHTYIVSGDVS